MLHDAAQWVIGIVQANAAYAAPIAFVLAFLKALAFVSMVVPSITVILAMGTLVGASGIEWTPVWIAASLGAGLGNWVSYAVGYRLQGRALLLWPFSRHPELVPRGARFFDRWGAMSIVLCRFFSPLRATVPLLSGIFAMPALPFQIANWMSAFLWAAVLLAPGSLFGAWMR